MARGSAIRSFTLDLDALSWSGRPAAPRIGGRRAGRDAVGLRRPGRGVRIDSDGGQELRPGWGGEPNGLAIDPDGNLVTANIALGRVQRMSRDGQVSTVLEEVDGQRTTSANFVFYDRRGRLWVTCLTRDDHWWPAVAHRRPDGFIVLVDERGARIVADGIYATNEARWTPRSDTCTSPRRCRPASCASRSGPTGRWATERCSAPTGWAPAASWTGSPSTPTATCG